MFIRHRQNFRSRRINTNTTDELTTTEQKVKKMDESFKEELGMA